MEKIAEKLFNMPWWGHFLLWFFITSIIFYITVILLGGEINIQPGASLYRGIIGLVSISAILTAMFTLINGMMKKSAKFYLGLEEIKKRTEDAKTAEELESIRSELLEYHSKKAFHNYHSQQCRIIIVKIDTRLKYEFKV